MSVPVTSLMSRRPSARGRDASGFRRRALALGSRCAAAGGPCGESVRVDQHIAERVHPAVMTREDYRGRVHLDDDRGTLDAVTGLEPRAVIDHRAAIPPFHVHALAAHRGGFRIRSAFADDRALDPDALALHYGPEAHHLVLERQGKSEQALVLGIEGL